LTSETQEQHGRKPTLVLTLPAKWVYGLVQPWLSSYWARVSTWCTWLYNFLLDRWWGQFGVFFVWELATFFMLAFNFRVLAKGSYFWTILSDGIISANGMIGLKAITEDERARTASAIVGNALGGMCGSAAGIFVTKRILGS
jgi:hypothetical protein